MNLKEFADRLGLSPTTVSRALNGYPEVSRATRDRVIAAAKQMNYHPNTRAQSLATGRAMAIGHVIPISVKHEMVNPVFGDFIAGAGETYSANGYDMVITVIDDGDEEQAYRNMHRRGSVDGVILHGPTMQDPRIDLLRELNLPFVVHGRASNVSTPYAWVDVNNHSAFQRAAGFLLDLGHRHLALINGLESMDFAFRRRQGVEHALLNRGLDPASVQTRSGEMTEDLGHSAVAGMLAGDTPPTAILTSSMILAIGARRAIEEAGLLLGRDVSLITHDDDLSYLRNGASLPMFTATRSSVRDAGRHASQMLLNMINEPEVGIFPNLLLEAELVVGRSTGPAPSKD